MYLLMKASKMKLPTDLTIAECLLNFFARPYHAVKTYIYARCYGSSKRTAFKCSCKVFFLGLSK